MTDKEIDEALAVCEAATPGPLVGEQEGRGGYNAHGSWFSIIVEPEEGWIGGTPEIAMCERAEDAAMFAAARTGWPRALKALQGARRERERTRLDYESRISDYHKSISHLAGQRDTFERERDEAREQAAVLREALECHYSMGIFTEREHGATCRCNGCLAKRALAPDAGRALLAELAGHRARATGLCSAHQTATDPACRTCYPDTGTEVAALRTLIGKLVRRMDFSGAGSGVTDHACATCVPGGESVIPGFACCYHDALARGDEK